MPIAGIHLDLDDFALMAHLSLSALSFLSPQPSLLIPDFCISAY